MTSVYANLLFVLLLSLPVRKAVDIAGEGHLTITGGGNIKISVQGSFTIVDVPVHQIVAQGDNCTGTLKPATPQPGNSTSKPTVLAVSTTSKPKITWKSCKEAYESGSIQSGVYVIDPRDGLGQIKVYCDMTTSGGGWTVFQRRQDGSVDFYRNWANYKNGFGNLTGEFWLGLDKISRLTGRNHVLRIDLEDFEHNTRYASYSTFSVGNKSTQYALTVGQYSGNAGDSLSLHNGMKFSTIDVDNDTHGINCAVRFQGGWWYNNCHHSNLNGKYLNGAHSSYANGVNWSHWKGYHYSLKFTEMKFR